MVVRFETSINFLVFLARAIQNTSHSCQVVVYERCLTFRVVGLFFEVEVLEEFYAFIQHGHLV
jgi:hypothetical protein